jgi:ribosomal protein S18 acetylase RimI-like enzyme
MRKNMLSNIRPMASYDKPGVMAILRDTPEFEPAEVPIAEEVLDSYLVSPGEGYLALVAENDGEVMGYICFGSTPLTAATWDIYWMAVARMKRGQGTGRMLLSEAEKQIERAGGRLILIETSSKPNYLATRRFYRHNEYRQAGRIKDFYAPGDHRITFEKRL